MATRKETLFRIAGAIPFVFLRLMIFLSTKSILIRDLEPTIVELFSTEDGKLS
jgi:hypothetical protein